MSLYLDSSALVKLVQVEVESAALRRYLRRHRQLRRVTSALARVEVVRALLACPADICVAVDTGFLTYWSLRFDDPLSDVESLQMDARQCITSIGDKVTDITEVQAQYIGLMKFSGAGAALLPPLIAEAGPPGRARGQARFQPGMLGRDPRPQRARDPLDVRQASPSHQGRVARRRDGRAHVR